MAAFQDPKACECTRSEIDLFSSRPVQTDMEQATWARFYPKTSIDASSPIVFEIEVPREMYLQTDNMNLYTKNSIMAPTGAAIANAAANDDPAVNRRVYPINYFGNTRFNNVDVYLNGKSIGTSDNMYPYRSMFECLLNYSGEAKQTQMAMGLFHKDTGQFEQADLGATIIAENCGNTGARARYNLGARSRTFETLTKVHVDICSQERFLMTGNKLRLVFHRAPSNFALMANQETEDFKVLCHSAYLSARLVNISNSVLVEHQARLLKEPALYPLRHVKMRFFTKPANSSDLSQNNLVTGVIPNRIVIGIVDTDAFNGLYTKNPFNFKHCNASEAILRVGNTALPVPKISTHYDNDEFKEAYMSMFTGTTGLFDDVGYGITLDDYKNGHTLLVFDLTPDQNQQENENVINTGEVNLELKLRGNNQNGVTLVCYMEYSGLLRIDHNKDVHMNYNP